MDWRGKMNGSEIYIDGLSHCFVRVNGLLAEIYIATDIDWSDTQL